jgi:PEP-CTERM motif-containing protein
MKLYSKLSALGAVLVLTTAFASADTINFSSSQGETFYSGFTAPNVNPLVPPGQPVGPPVLQGSGVNNDPIYGSAPLFLVPFNVVGINPGTVWAPAMTGSTWVSYDPNSGPTGGENGGSSPYDADGFYTYFTFLATSGGIWSGSVTVAADDTVEVLLNGVMISNFGTIGGDGQCADGTPNCRTGQSQTVDFGSLTPGFLNDGTNVLSFVVAQTGSIDQGLDYSGSISSTPEPNTLILLGTGLLGTAGALFRKMRAA